MRRVFIPAFGGMKVLHRDRVPKGVGLIVAPNHISHADPPLVSCALPRQVAFLAKKELFNVPILGALIRALGAFPVKRGEADTEAMRRTIRLLEQGKAVLVFPEGKRGDGKTIGPSQRGIELLAKKTGALILPVGICGSDRLLPKGAKFPRFARVTIVFGEPYTMANKKGAAFRNDLMERISSLMSEAGCKVTVNYEDQNDLQK